MFVSSGLTGTYTVPSFVTRIESSAMRGGRLSKCVIGPQVTYLGTYVLCESKITEFEFPPQMTSVAEAMFYGCHSLTTVKFTDSITQIQNYAFYDCSALKNLVLPSKLKSIGNNAFAKCFALGMLTLPAECDQIGDGVFKEISITIYSLNPEIQIDNYVMYKNNRQTITAYLGSDDTSNIIVNSSCTLIGSGAFQSKSFAHVTFDNNEMINISSYAFASSTIKSITFPAGLKQIDQYAFSECKSLTRVSFQGSQITEIPDYCFYESKLSIMEKEINEYKNDFWKILELRSNSDFDAVYNFLKKLSEEDDKLKMSISCAVGLSEIQNPEGWTPLLNACVKGDLQLTKSLIEGGCDKNAVTKNENNCLLLASYNGHLEIVKYLIGIGFDKNWRSKLGYNAILLASQEGQLDTVKYLKSIGCDVNSKANCNASCIYLSSCGGHLETVKYLFSVGADPNERENNGCPPIIIASQEGHLEVVKYLIQCGCNKNDKTDYNSSSLHWAAENGHFEVVEYLVSIGVNLNDKDNGGKTALDLAKEKQYENDNYRKIVDLLNRSGAK
ncbi:surface antigen BspA-like [Trichomonas vaginalis G3]|uniref:Surface antigen BspA-like n=1 Tax=Trichomonas vaginalis (strain ATCC PRA-98 / G3) TaxID=412133 RepID=A2FMD0_TRIV3|nr:protein ubiquitination [Trichomonas vaginalis G3]EAX93947.1 surface antigen BspA-like [Trichomonas vaginalis G3]KAI5549060.1 protein ubiquitination [Trichomonas vaginalis G3]|eukprot:XP_001306877.1 surface antigen BspA-like [Trichomonas vaginalis G3]